MRMKIKFKIFYLGLLCGDGQEKPGIKTIEKSETLVGETQGI